MWVGSVRSTPCTSANEELGTLWPTTTLSQETAVPAVGGDQQQHSMGQILRLLGRQKCFLGREDELHDWSLKFGATAPTLSDHASVWMSGALQHTTEITLDQPDEASGRMFALQMYTLVIHLCEGRALAIVRGAPDQWPGSVETTA